MSDDVRLVRPDDRSAGPPTPGMHREEAVATGGLWAGHVTTEAGAVSGWHHHGDHESTIYVVSGSLRMEFGAGGEQVLEAQAGDFLYVPPHAVHREGNPGGEQSAIVVVRTGSGEAVVNVDGPTPG